MEIEIHWEISPKLNDEELKILLETVHNIARNTDHFDFFNKNHLWEPLFLNVIVISDPEIKSMNLKYRSKNETTDVLTFPFDETRLVKNQPNSAEIYISQDTAARQCNEHNLTLLNEFIILLVHGLLHAFHYDHETSEESSIEMKYLEKKILSYLGVDSAPLTT
ncbi:MAG: rRNA maturation RNase YbeY [Spirochaetia bacterium]|nr:rRNA maturation RNase YbeY [Spirochaetia bacterium]